MSEIISVKKLTKKYGNFRAVSNISFNVQEGEIFGLIGPNGAGKSTTMRSMLEYLTHMMHLRNKPEKINYAKSLAKKFDLDLNKKSKQLSKGNKQKIGIIQAFCHDPEILILDEPTSGLDPLKQQEFDELILKYKEKGKTIFISSHVLPEVEMLCDRVAIIKNGKIVAENTMAQLKSMAINRFEVIFKNEVPERKFGKSIGVKNISKSGEKFIFDVEGDVNKFIKKISENKVISFRSMEPDLEEIFLSFYKKNKSKK